MLAIRCATKSRHSLYPLPRCLINSISTAAAVSGDKRTSGLVLSSYLCEPASSPRPPSIQPSDIFPTFKQWFLSPKNPRIDQIFDILRVEDGAALDAALCRLNLGLTESLVIEVFKYGDPEIEWHCCKKFFEWAGRQNDFGHTPVTCHAMFRILLKARQLPAIEECLDVIGKQSYPRLVNFHAVMVIGYAMAGKIEVALNLLGRMRFSGLDLDRMCYHVLLNSLVENGYFDMVNAVADQIRMRGYENGVTNSILVKKFCKQKELDKAEEFLRRLMSWDVNGDARLDAVAVATFVDALCKDKQFERGAQVVCKVAKLSTVPMEPTYNVWIKNLVEAGKIDGALEFLKGMKALDGYVPDVYRYNSLLQRLLRENRHGELYDLLTEMKELDVLPDNVTMNATLCFCCKLGMLDVALELYNSRADFGLSMNTMAYNYLMNTLLGDASVDNLYSVLRNAIQEGVLPGRRIFSFIASREKMLDKMIELITVALDKNFAHSRTVYDRFIFALCESERWDDAYKLYEKFNSLGRVPGKSAYAILISGLSKVGEGNRAVKLLIEMQENANEPDRNLFRDVIRCFCAMDTPDTRFFGLLEKQTSRFLPTCSTYNYFIDGAGHAGKYQWAIEVYAIMERNGIQPNLKSDILMLQSFIKNEKTADGLNFFHDLCKKREVKRKLRHVVIVSLCKTKKLDCALEMFWDLRANNVKPSMECYEELVKLLCASELPGKYHLAIEIIDDLSNIGRQVSSFIGNVLLYHSWKCRDALQEWLLYPKKPEMTDESWNLVKLMYAFAEPIKGYLDTVDMETLIAECFPLDTLTYNMLLQRLIIIESKYLNRLQKRGLDPNCGSYGMSVKHLSPVTKYFNQLMKRGLQLSGRSYDMLVKHLADLGQTAEARKVGEEMESKEFELTEGTKKYVEDRENAIAKLICRT